MFYTSHFVSDMLTADLESDYWTEKMLKLNWKLKLKILPLQSQYIFPLLLFKAKNRDQFISNSEIHGIDTRYNNNFHYPSSNLSTFQKGPHYFGIKVFNNLLSSIKNLAHNTKPFRSALKRFLLLNLFYSLKEYFNYNNN